MTGTTDATPPEPDSEAAWRRWWDAQYDFRIVVDKQLETALRGRSDQFSAALVAAMIEYLGERLRMYLRLPEGDAGESE
jgi:hypothetical protein